MARSVQVVITADARGMSRGVSQANAQLSSLNATAKKSEQSLSKVNGFFDKLQGGAVAAAGIAAVGTAIKSVVNSASNLQQATGSVEAIFDLQAQTVINGAKNWQQYGLSQSAALQSSALLGNQLKQLGYEGDNLIGTTDQLLLTAADMAATFGGTTPQALEALQAALRGSYARLDEFGINISETMVSAKASTEGLTTQQAALALILEQSAEFAGQATRELDTYASKQQAAAAAIENAKAALGEGLLPVATSVAGALGTVGTALAAIPAGFISAAGSVGVAVAAFKLIDVASVRTQSRLIALESSLTRANKPTRALAAGLGQLGVAKLATGLQVAAGAFIVAQFAMQKWAKEVKNAVPSVEDLRTQLLAVNSNLNDMQFQFDKIAGQKPFEGQAQGLNEIADALEREAWYRFEFLPFTKSGAEQRAAEEFIRNQAAAIQELQKSNPELAARRYDELVSAITNLPVDQQRQWLDLLEQSSTSAGSASTSYLTLAESMQKIVEAQKAINEQYAVQDFQQQNAQAQQEYAEALAATKQSIEDNGDALKNYTAEQIIQGKASRSSSAATREQAASLLDLGKKNREAATSQALATGSIRQGTAVIRQGRQEVIAAARAMGLSKAEANALADAVGLIPREWRTNYKLNKNNADIQLVELQNRLAGVTGTRYADIIVRTTYQGKPLAVPGQVGPGLNARSTRDALTREVTPRATPRSALGSSGANYWLAVGDGIGSAIQAGAQAALDKGISLPVNFLRGESNYKKLFLIDAKVKDKNKKEFKEIVDDVVGYWQDKYEKLYGRLEDLERQKASLAKSLASSITAFSITDQLSGVRDVASQIADLRKQADEATIQSWSHLDPIIAELQSTTDPARFAELQNTYQQLIAQGPRLVADTQKRAELEAEIAKLQSQSTLSDQIKAQVDRTKEFADQLRLLKAQGLGPDQLAEIAKAGPEAGLELAKQLSANKGLRDQWMIAFREMNKYSKDIGKDIAKFQFNPDVKKVESKLKELWKRSSKQFEKDLQEKLDKADLKVKVEIIPVSSISGGGGGFASNRRQSSAASAPLIGSLTINGAIDPEGTARSVNRVLNQHAARLGRS